MVDQLFNGLVLHGHDGLLPLHVVAVALAEDGGSHCGRLEWLKLQLVRDQVNDSGVDGGFVQQHWRIRDLANLLGGGQVTAALQGLLEEGSTLLVELMGGVVYTLIPVSVEDGLVLVFVVVGAEAEN